MNRRARFLFLVPSILAAVAAGPAGAQNQFGLFFDLGADNICTHAAFLAHVPIYLIYLDPTPALISGCELAIRIDRAVNSTITVTNPTGTLLGNVTRDQIVALWDPPLPCTAKTVLLHVDLFYLDFTPLSLAIDGAAVPSLPLIGPYVILPDGSGMVVGEAVNAYPDLLCFINDMWQCEVPQEPTAWSTVKCLYGQ